MPTEPAGYYPVASYDSVQYPPNRLDSQCIFERRMRLLLHGPRSEPQRFAAFDRADELAFAAIVTLVYVRTASNAGQRAVSTANNVQALCK